MVLANHIAHNFLTTEDIQSQIMTEFFPDQWQLLKSYQKRFAGDNAGFKQAVNTFPFEFWTITSLIFNESLKEQIGDNKNYYVTNTVLDILKMFKIKRQPDGHYDWTVFKEIENFQKVTFILPNNSLLRIEVLTEVINFCHIDYKKNPQGGAVEGKVNWLLFYVNRAGNTFSGNIPEIERKNIDTFIYSLLCFVYLADNDEVIIPPGKAHGQNKKDKTLNNTNFPVTIINSRWNTTVINQDPSWVTPFWTIRWTGAGRTKPRSVFIAPFQRRGRISKAKSLTVK